MVGIDQRENRTGKVWEIVNEVLGRREHNT